MTIETTKEASKRAHDLSQRIERRIELSMKNAGIKVKVMSILFPELIQAAFDVERQLAFKEIVKLLENMKGKNTENAYVRDCNAVTNRHIEAILGLIRAEA